MAIAQLKEISVEAPRVAAGISLFPLVPRDAIGESAKAAIAIADDSLVVEELPHATVPQLVVRNQRNVPVLIPAGKILEGGRQTRTVNVSILVPAGATLDIPVSCVEAGRWGGGRSFGDSKRYASRSVRARKQRSVVENLVRSGRKSSDQGEVWRTINLEFSRRNLHSSSDLFLVAEASLDTDNHLKQVLDALVADGPADNQVGVGVAYNGEIAGIELFSDPQHLRANWEALVRNIVFDLPFVESMNEPREVTESDVVAFLERMQAEEVVESEGVGLGTEFHITKDDLVAQALVLDDTLVYANAFVGS